MRYHISPVDYYYMFTLWEQLFGHAILTPVIRFALFNRLNYSPRPPPRIDIHHELRIRPRQHLDIPINGKGIIELPRRLRFAVLHIADFTVDADLHARLGIVVARLFRSDPACLARHQWRVRVHDRRREVQHAADGDGVLESGRVERDERRSDVGEGCCAAEG